MNDQFLRRHALCRVIVDGRDVTNILDPYLISVKIIDKVEGVNTAALELDDRDARLGIPADESVIDIELGWSSEGPRVPAGAQSIAGEALTGISSELPFGGAGGMTSVFKGVISSVESGFSRRGGGRRLWIEATGANQKGNGKTNDHKIEGDGITNVPFSEVFKKWAGEAGYPNAEIGGKIGSVMRPTWSMGRSESFHAWADRITAEMGGRVSFSGGDTASVTGALDNLTASGVPMASVSAIWGVNLIAWRIRPFQARPQYGRAASQWFDVPRGMWDATIGSIGGDTPFGAANARAGVPNPAPNSQVAEQWNKGITASSTVERGTGWVIINGEPLARAHASLVISGARPGVDGTWAIKEAEHSYSRKTGYTTRCDLENPNISAGDFGWSNKRVTEPTDKPIVPQGT